MFLNLKVLSKYNLLLQLTSFINFFIIIKSARYSIPLNIHVCYRQMQLAVREHSSADWGLHFQAPRAIFINFQYFSEKGY